MSSASNKIVSIVIPVFNEEKGLPSLYQIITALMEKSGYPFEIVVSDNGSRDNTEALMQEIVARDKRWRYARLSRNFGYQNNISAGMAMASGDAIVVIDADLQDPPEMIYEFLKRWEEGYEVVYGVRSKRTGEPRLRIAMTMFAMNLIRWMADYPLPAHSADFRLITRKVRDVFIHMPENSRFVRGMIHWIGFKQIGIPYVRRGRQFDAPKRSWGGGIFSLFNFMLDAIFSFSVKPLRLFSIIGLLVLLLSGVLFIAYFVLRLTDPDLPRGFTTQLLITILQMGITSLGIGVLGEYIGRIYIESKNRPLWIIDYTLNFEYQQNRSVSTDVPLEQKPMASNPE